MRTQLRQHSALGGPAMMKRRFLQFVRESEERTGRVAAARGAGGWKGGRRWNSKGGESVGRWGGRPKRGGMSGVGVGASPAFRHSSSSTTVGGRGGGEGTTKGTKLSLERSLLKELRERLEAEQAVADVLEQQQQQQQKKPKQRRAAAAAVASTGTEAERGGGSVDLTGDGDDGEGRDASPLRGDGSGHAGEDRRRKVGTGKKRSREGDGGQSGDEASVPEERGGGRGGRKEDGVGVGGGRCSSSSSEGRKASAGRGGVSRGRGSRGGSGRGGRSARGGGNASGASSAARTGEGGAEGCASGGGGGGGGGEDLVFEPLPSLHAVVFSYAQARESLNILQDLEPDFVVLYDPDAAFVRTLEAYQAGRPLDRPPLVVYFMLYEQSVEEQRYLTSLDRETKAFKSLIEEKARMTVPVRTTTSLLPTERTAREGKVTRLSTPLAEAGKGSSSGSSRKGGRRKPQAPLRVVVDLREFRSVLPNLLHQQGFELVPLVIAVGDYVLTPQICVERKSLSDLFQSMSSGRLYNQVEAMLKHYKVPVLLIEFNPDKAFCLLGSGDLTSEIKLTSITSQLTLLTLHFPQLRILWSKSEHATADMFKELMKNNAVVDVVKAQAAGGGGEDDQGTVDDASAKELLMRLPGVNVYNFRNVLREVDTIAELSQLSEEQLRPLLGEGNASKLFKFFRQPAPV